jgi:hypothetical protein
MGDYNMAVLQDVSKTNGKLSDKELIAQLLAENAKLKESRNRSLSLKVSAKGAVSVYGMGRFPLTLYSGQWEKLFSMVDQIKAFIEANKASLAVKE